MITSDMLSPTEFSKISIVGCGKVGMSTAFALLLSGAANQIMLFGRNADDVIGEQLDLEHALSFLSSTKIDSTAEYQDLANSDIVIITAGAAQKPGDNRLDLASKNTAIIEDMIPAIVKYSPNAVIIIVTNPVDVLTYKAYLAAGLPKGRIFGTGTILDTSRFRFHLSEIFKVNPRSIHAYILGEHGDSSFAATSSATIGGQPLNTFPGYSEEKIRAAYQKSRDAAYKIIASKGATYYAIAVAVVDIIGKVLRDSRSILPVSIPLHGQYDQHGVALSVPCVIGRGGVQEIIETKLNWEEKQNLEKSAKMLKQYL
jgi:L-lactate dehydrogenase